MAAEQTPDNTPADAFSTSGSSPPRATDRLIDTCCQLDSDIPLQWGCTLPAPNISYRIEGSPQAPTVLVLGGISADKYLEWRPSGEAGWWPEMVGRGRALDPGRLRIVSVDFIAGHSGPGEPHRPASDTTGARISTRDQALAILGLCTALGIEWLDGIVGASYGGMVGLALAQLRPDFVRRLFVISASDQPHPLATAWRHVQRQIVRLGRELGEPRRALALARELAMTTYRSRDEFLERFAGNPVATPEGPRHPVQDYLEARGRDFSRTRCPDRYLSLSESIDLHRVDLASLRCRTDFVAVDSDHLVPACSVRSAVDKMGPLGHFHLISSKFGHDAFLKESSALTRLIDRHFIPGLSA